jgi:hypothetical protein
MQAGQQSGNTGQLEIIDFDGKSKKLTATIAIATL